jgi:hypothetical protein
MAADQIVYCLEHVTDYWQFERLCNDLMTAEGYDNLEPLGGTGDKGRDAIRICRTNTNDITIFAYSVREDWLVKLKSDAKRIKNVGHQCHTLVFSCNSHYSATERDDAVCFIFETYGWRLELYGLERFRTLLSAKHERILTKHPQIFTPPFFPKAGGQPLSYSPDLVVIDFSDNDEALATWLARKLKLHGYGVWCRSIDPVGGETINDTTGVLFEQRAAACLSLLSQPAIEDSDLTYRRSIAHGIAKKRNPAFLVPLISQPIYEESLDANTAALEKISFTESWQAGLNAVIEVLDTANCPKADGGEHFALNSFFPEDVIVSQKETIFSNIFKVLKVPETIHLFESAHQVLPSMAGSMANLWAYRKVDDSTFLSFHFPPNQHTEEFGFKKKGGAIWEYLDDMEGIAIRNLVPELIRKELVVHCMSNGLQFCKNTKLIYFPHDLLPNDRYYFDFYDGSKTFVQLYGERKYYKPFGSERYRYHLSPNFYIFRQENGTFAVLLRIYIRLTDLSGKCLEGRTIVSRRKHLCHDWFNDQWLKRIVGIMRFLGPDGTVEIGKTDKDRLVICSHPCSWEIPFSINEEALNTKSLPANVCIEVMPDADEEEE